MEPLPETQRALEELARFDDSGLAETLLVMGKRAKQIVPECVGLSLSSVQDDTPFTLIATDDESAILDAVQYLDGGPCVEAVERPGVLAVHSDDLLDEGRWLMYASASAAAGVASSLSSPIIRDGRVIGGVNLDAATVDAFEGRRDRLAAALHASAEGAVANADLEFNTRLEAAEAPNQILDLQDIDLAVGMIAEGYGIDLETARGRLQDAAARAGITVARAARAVRHLRVE